MDVSLLHQAKCIIRIGKMPSFTDRIEEKEPAWHAYRACCYWVVVQRAGRR